MKRSLRIVLVVASAIVGVASSGAQQVSDPAKREPPPRPVAVPAPEQEVPAQDPRTASGLPNIELPEYVITGVGSIDLPAAEKTVPSDKALTTLADTQGPGRREVFEWAPRLTVQRADEPSVLPETRARLSASIGTFMSPRLEGWFAQRYEVFDYAVAASYSKTNGFAPWTNRSGGSVTADGGYLIGAESPYFDAARLSGLLDFASQTYRLYGSIDPSLKRATDGVRFDAGFSSSIKSPWQYRAGLAIASHAVKESTLSARQNLAEFLVASDIPTAIVPLVADLRISLATRSALADENTSMVKLGVETQRYWWDSFFGQAGLRLFLAKGMSGQSLTRLYPVALVGYQFPSIHAVMIGYEGEVRFSTLDGLVRANPYVSSSAPIRHINVPLRFVGTLESEWSADVVTRLTVRWEQWTDEPLYSDSAGRGVWDLEYLGTTTRLEGQLEAFANIWSNGYFALSVVGRTSEIDETSVGVPYLPEAEVSLLYRHRFPMGVSLIPRMSVFGRRTTDPRSELFLAAYVIAGLRAEYSPLESLTVFADIDNMLDVRYEVWKGYRGHPFLMTAGVSYVF